MSSEKSFFSEVLGAVRKVLGVARTVLSPVIGLAVALPASVVFGTAYLAAEMVNICYSYSLKRITGTDKLTYNPTLSNVAESLKGWFFGVWTGFGIYPYLEGTKKLYKEANKLFMWEGEESTYFDANNVFNTNPKESENLVKKEVATSGKEFFSDKSRPSSSPNPTNAVLTGERAASHSPRVGG